MRTYTKLGTISFVIASLTIFTAFSFNSLPDKRTIAIDLIGRIISEGTDNGYFSSDWHWKIESGEIQEVDILNEKRDEETYMCVAQVILKGQNSPTLYRATLHLEYTFLNERWSLYIVRSLGVDIIPTNKYVNCISTKIDDDGWGGVNCLKIKNNIDSSLIVGGVYRTKGTYTWHKFSAIIDGFNVVGIGGTFNYGSVVDYKIHFVEAY